MSGTAAELLLAPLRALRRATILWAVGMAVLVAATVSVWPAFKGGSGVSQAIDQLPRGVIQAFGLAGFDTPAGFLRGNLYAFFVPLLLVGVAIYFVSSLTAGEEDAGRLELVLTQPVPRRAVFAGRAAAALAGLAVIAVVTALAQFGSDATVNLSIGADRLGATLALAVLLALFHGCLAVAVAGLRSRPSVVLGVAFLVAIAGMVVSLLFPLSAALKPFAHLSPWDWAFGGDPLVNGAPAWRYLALGLPSLALGVFGVWAFGRRDIRAA
ncbi:MAG: ABC transporter permease subunit [Candidatus Dormibacteria bacterium]